MHPTSTPRTVLVFAEPERRQLPMTKIDMMSKQLSSFPPIFVPPPHLNSLRHILPWNDPWLCHSSKLPPITLPWPLTILGASHDIDTHVCVWVPRCRSSGRCCASWILALFSTSTPDLMFHLDRLNEAVLGHCGLDFCGTNKRFVALTSSVNPESVTYDKHRFTVLHRVVCRPRKLVAPFLISQGGSSPHRPLGGRCRTIPSCFEWWIGTVCW
ncbi:hypothetical protein DFH06DRAFT_1320657 [Mycena polygramma]|nr:hypothetical protein DFH06DRAFT_1320657 [Mycena polygramma]